MTTSWSQLTHGRVEAALRTHVGGTILGLVAFVVGGWTLIEAAAARRARPAHLIPIAAFGGGCFLSLILVEWVYRLTML